MIEGSKSSKWALFFPYIQCPGSTLLKVRHYKTRLRYTRLTPDRNPAITSPRVAHQGSCVDPTLLLESLTGRGEGGGWRVGLTSNVTSHVIQCQGISQHKNKKINKIQDFGTISLDFLYVLGGGKHLGGGKLFLTFSHRS